MAIICSSNDYEEITHRTEPHLNWLPQLKDWSGLKSIISLRRTILKGTKESAEIRFFISSLQPRAEHQGKIIQGHWGIENCLHWQRNVTILKSSYNT